MSGPDLIPHSWDGGLVCGAHAALVCAVCVHQLGDLESEVDYRSTSGAVAGAVAVPSTVPVVGESFCRCDLQEQTILGSGLQGFSPISDCLCGEEDHGKKG